MKFSLSLLLTLSLLLAGCASPDTGGGRTLRFTPPPVRYETFEPVFSEVPAQRDSAAVFKSAVTSPLRETVTLAWSYPSNELAAIDSFRLYASPDLTVPLPQWPLLTNVAAPALTVTLPLTPQQYFFYATASNYWGESVPSNSASTPAPPRFINTLGITR